MPRARSPPRRATVDDHRGDRGNQRAARRARAHPGRVLGPAGLATIIFAEAVASFLRSCDKLAGLPTMRRSVADRPRRQGAELRKAWGGGARASSRGGDAAARCDVRAEFVPYAAAGAAGPTGKLTGYYVAELHASAPARQVPDPVLGRPTTW